MKARMVGALVLTLVVALAAGGTPANGAGPEAFMPKLSVIEGFVGSISVQGTAMGGGA